MEHQAQCPKLGRYDGDAFTYALYSSEGSLWRAKEMNEKQRSKTIFALCVFLAFSRAAFGYGNWYDEVERSEPPYVWMQELASVKLTWGIAFSEYAKPQPVSRLQFVRDIVSAVDALRSVLERVRERGLSVSDLSPEDACALIGLPTITVTDVERLSALLRALIKYFTDDIDSLSPEEGAKHLLSVVDSFESETKAFLGKLKRAVTQHSPTGLVNLSTRKSWGGVGLLTPFTAHGGFQAGFTFSPVLQQWQDGGLTSQSSDIVIAYWLGEGRVSLNDAATTTVVLPFMSLQVSSQQLRPISSGDAERLFKAQVAIPFGSRWRLLGGYTQRLPAWSGNMTVSDLLRYGGAGIGGQYEGNKVKAYALYTRFGEHAHLSGAEPLWGLGSKLHGVDIGLTWHPSRRLVARYRLQLLSSIGDERDYKVHMGEVGYLWNERWAFTFGVRRAIAPFGVAPILTDAVLGVSYAISPQAELRLLYRITDYENKQRHSQEEAARLQLQLRF
ncbi:MAG: hypothetical protein RMK18_04595 [Armatimonadota bacterium]|nr:hypothetical protein [Armatimonadota bacterium]MDW8025129.1 hypothetical protein [Armatimonadota bacterium]